MREQLDEAMDVSAVDAAGAIVVLVVPDRQHRHLSAKRAMDLSLATLGLLITAPLMLVIALAVRLDSPGSAFFRQTRQGKDGRPFEICKFRTMHRAACDDGMGPSCRQAAVNDLRVTRLGRWLRRSSLDELPQLLNVLRGEMSLVGPRPHAVAHDQHYRTLIPNYAARQRLRPGMSGLAQVNGHRGETRTVGDMQRRIELDIHYIDSWSLSLDLKIIVRTLFAGFSGRNAY